MKILPIILMSVVTVTLTLNIVAAEDMRSAMKSWAAEVTQKMEECKFSSPYEADDYLKTGINRLMKRVGPILQQTGDVDNFRRYFEPALYEIEASGKRCVVRLYMKGKAAGKPMGTPEQPKKALGGLVPGAVGSNTGWVPTVCSMPGAPGYEQCR